MKKLIENYHKMPKNFITPKILKFEQYNDTIIELSEGVSMNNNPIFGVSEFKKANTRYGLESTRRGGLFYTKKEALKNYSLLKLN